MFWEILQTVLLIILIDRNLIIRERYKLAIEHEKPTQWNTGYFAIWIYCRQKNESRYIRCGGKKLWHFQYGKIKL